MTILGQRAAETAAAGAVRTRPEPNQAQIVARTERKLKCIKSLFRINGVP